jgi:hypothetical protein
MEVKTFTYMALLYAKKYVNVKALDIDTTKKQVKIAIAETETVDSDGDLIVPTACNKTMAECGPAGSNEIWHLLDHSKTSFSALSKFSEMGMYGKYVGGISLYKDSFAWREVAWPLYESGDFNQHSIGYSTIKEQKMGTYNELQELKLYEGSAVLWGANKYTPTLAIQKSLGISEKDDIISQFERLCKAIKLGKSEDETHRELIILEIKRIQQSVASLQEKSTTPSNADTQPGLEEKELLNAINIIRAKIAVAV